MENKNLEEQIIQLLAHAYRKPNTDGLTRDSVIAEVLSPRSLEMVGFVAMLEKDLDVMIPLGEAMKMKTIGDMIDKVKAGL